MAGENSRSQASPNSWIAGRELWRNLDFHHGVDLPHMGAYTLLATDDGVRRLERYFADYIAIARMVISVWTAV